WPSPIPIVKEGRKWRFDTAAGLDEILSRGIGGKTLSTISPCRAYALRQGEQWGCNDVHRQSAGPCVREEPRRGDGRTGCGRQRVRARPDLEAGRGAV